MKKLFKFITMSVMLVAICLSFTACDFLTIYVKEPGDQTQTETETDFGKEVHISDYYKKTYDVKSVDMRTAKALGEPQKLEDAVAMVNESVVTVMGKVTGGTQIGSGIMIDIGVEYKDPNIKTSDFVYIITCHHVIEDSTAIAVYLPKLINEASKEYSYLDYAFGATIVGTDKDNDIAILRIEISDYDGLSVNDIVKSKINDEYLVRGQSVFAIGNPGGDLPGWMSSGVISNVCVPVEVDKIGRMELVGTDAAINHGNSGGGLFNMYGQLVGIVNAGDSELDGIGFAVPMTGKTGALYTATELIKSSTDEKAGYLKGKWKLGAAFQEVSLSGSASEKYIQIVSLENYSPLKRAGILAKQYVLEVNYPKDGKNHICKMNSLREFTAFYEQMKEDLVVGDKVNFVVTNNLKTKGTPIEVTLEQYSYNV